jgi:transposase
MVIADEASDAGERVLRPLEPAGKTAVIPPRANRNNPRPYDRELDRARHLIENSSARLEQDRAIATRYDERAVPFLGAIHLAAAIIRLT